MFFPFCFRKCLCCGMNPRIYCTIILAKMA
nr:MAG TPA: retinoic acid receptor RXR-alpha [Caudoviricetes sp.]